MRLGTRGSLLARTQSQWVADRITAATDVTVELVIISTKGDRVTDRPLQQVGGKGLFTKEIEQALLDGDVDLAVHSMKDMPTDQPAGLVFGAVPEREDPRDVLVGSTLDDLAPGAVVGTGSARREAQLRAARPDLDIRGIRGNVDTRIRKQVDGEYDAIVLAAAGMARLGRLDEASDRLDPDLMVPAVGQGALAVQCRRDDTVTLGVLEAIHHERTGICVAAERAFLIAIAGGCSVPAACHVTFEDDHTLLGRGMFVVDGDLRRATVRSDPLHGVAMGRGLADQLKG